MFEAIKELTGNDLAVERIEGFEPNWWGADADSDAAADTQAAPTRSRAAATETVPNGTTAANAMTVTSAATNPQKPTKPIPAPPAHHRRTQPPQPQERQPCALLQPNFGAK